FTCAFVLMSAGVLAEHMLSLVYRRQRETFWGRILESLFSHRNLYASAALAIVAAVLLVWPGLVEYVRTSHVTLHWSRPLDALVFVPLMASHRLLHLELLRAAVITGAAFSVCASAIYILNDILDIRSDRLHPRKRRRPCAAGELSIPFGIAAASVLLAASAAIAIVG